MIARTPFLLAAVCLAAWLAPPTQAQNVESINVACTGSGQQCNPPYATTINNPVRGVVFIEYTASSGHCSLVRVHISVDGVEKNVSSFVSAGEGTGMLTLGVLSQGNHSLSVQAEGQTGGCNIGNIAGWAGTLSLTFPAAPSLRGSIAHFVSQDGWQEDVVILNTGTSETSGQLKFSAENGAAMPVPLTDQKTGMTSVVASLDSDFTSRGMLPITSRGLATLPLLVGSTRLYGDQNLDGFAIFRFKPTNQEAVVPLETRNSPAYILAFDNTNHMSTGVAISSIFDRASSVDIIIRNDQGVQIGTSAIQLAAYGHTSFVLADRLPVTKDLRGTLEIVTPELGRLSAVGIRFTPPGTLTTIPVLVNEPNLSGSLAHFASGGGWRTILVLVNTGTSTAQANLRFYSDDGSPALLPISLPQTGGPSTPSSSISRSLSAKQVFVLESAGGPDDPLKTGSVQFTSDGNISGFAVFRYEPNGQEAAVTMENRSNVNSYTIAFDNTEGVVTGMAVNNASAGGTTVPVVIRDQNAVEIFRGAVSLPGNDHTSFILTTLFPVTANRRGSIEFLRQDGTQIGVVGIRSQPALTFTSLPSIAR
ncbi:MAG: hypothetical protein ABI811_03575 [Acidobacteriota bacterium]